MNNLKTIGAKPIYTRQGDQGTTSLLGKNNVSKAATRIEACGTIDELNSWIGFFIEALERDVKATKNQELKNFLLNTQKQLFDIGCHVSCVDELTAKNLPTLNLAYVENLEKKMDQFSLELSELNNFILPTGTLSASLSHLIRTVCRRSERSIVRLLEEENFLSCSNLIVQYLNRLSDFFFVLARYINYISGRQELIWKREL